MHILSIGNSFSQDSHRWLHDICESGGYDVTTVNLYIGGCSLERHCENLDSGEAAYDLEYNGGGSSGKISLQDGLRLADWDVITVQQCSHFSGRPQTYFPYLEKLTGYVRSVCPASKLYVYETWAYEIDSDHGHFPDYNCSQSEMFRRLKDCYELAAQVADAPLIRTGELIQHLRTLPAFDYANGGLSLNRDGFHMSLLYGRYALAAMWYELLVGGDIRENTFTPQTAAETAAPALLTLIQNEVHAFCHPQ